MHNFYDMFPSKDVPSGGEDKNNTHLRGQKSPKVPFLGGGVNSRFLAKRVNIKSTILSKLHRLQPKFVQRQRQPNTLVGGQTMRPANPRWRTAAILEKWTNRDISVTA